MNSETSRLKQKQEAELGHDVNSAARTEQGMDFESVEDLLRHDSSENPVPQGVGERVRNSIVAEPRKPRSWWERIFS